METKKKKGVGTRAPMPCQPAEERRHNFKEVALGYDEATAMAEAGRCLQCKKPGCVTGCPVGVPIRISFGALREGNCRRGLPSDQDGQRASRGLRTRVPPGEAVREQMHPEGQGQPVAIGRLERYVADNHSAATACEAQTGHNACAAPVPGKRVACIGSGPSSLSCAGYCASQGIKVDVYEALHEAGGVLIYGIPSFRLPRMSCIARLTVLRNLALTFIWTASAAVLSRSTNSSKSTMLSLLALAPDCRVSWAFPVKILWAFFLPMNSLPA